MLLITKEMIYNGWNNIGSVHTGAYSSGCSYQFCGGGSVKVKGDKIKDVAAVKTIYIEGMHCSNCSDRVQNALNSLSQVNAKVDLKKKQAVVKLGREVSDDELKSCVERCGYSVTGIG